MAQAGNSLNYRGGMFILLPNLLKIESQRVIFFKQDIVYPLLVRFELNFGTVS